jgi:hypothetical protein
VLDTPGFEKVRIPNPVRKKDVRKKDVMTNVDSSPTKRNPELTGRITAEECSA